MDSLLQHDTQPELLTSAQMPRKFFTELEKRGEFTGERLHAQRPDDYAAIIRLSAEGIGQIAIGQMVHVSPNTVRAVQRREGIAIDMVKKGLSEDFLCASRLCVEEIFRRVADEKTRKKISTRDLGIIAGIAAQRGLELDGGMPSVSVNFEVPVDAQSFKRFLSSIGSSAPAAGQKPEGQAEPIQPPIECESTRNDA